MKNNASLLYGFFLVIGDFLALVAAFVSAYIIRVKLDPRPLVAQIAAKEYLEIFLFLLPFWLIIFGLLGLYNKNTYENRFSEFGRLLIGSFVGILFVISYAYITNTEVFPARLVTVYGLLLAFAFVLLFRTIARGIRRSLFNYGIGINNVLIVGETKITTELIEAIGRTKVTGYKIVGIVGKPKHDGDYRHFDTFADAIKALKSKGLQSIIQTQLYAEPERNSEILAFAQENHIAYRFVPGNSELFVGNIDVDLFHSIPVIAVHQTAIVGWGRVVKRIFDIVISLTVLTVLSPLMVLVVLLVKITDPKGPVFFRQIRLTRFDQKFKVYKFRSMYSRYGKGTPEDDFILMGRPDLAKAFRANKEYFKDDPRITPLGRFLRQTSLDELPQLFNVIKGDISLVGPRALIPQELEVYERRHAILAVKSGLTGLAQISGRKDITFDERRQLDLYYVQNWSFWSDIVILLRTISVVLFHRGAK
jgi:exopolysaccharide biosynthesis polyprenyl glycosylphosphotransferase